MIVLGIDPGSVRVGYGLIKTDGNRIFYLESGLLRVNSSEIDSLRAMEENLKEIIKKHKPVRAGVEKIFFVRNQKTGIKVAEARGVILNTIAKMGLEIKELSPSEVKLSLTGNGGASKKGVAKMVRFFVELPEGKIIDDATDAVAIAIAVSRKSMD